MLLQWPHTAYKCVVGSWHIFDTLKDVLSGKSIEEEQDVFLKWLGMQSEVFVSLLAVEA